MNCPNCQKTLEENARFCLACGLIFIADTPRGSKRAATDADATRVKTDPMLGRTLDGRYELLARLGQGGMGTVYRARRVHIGDEVAVKVLHQNYSTEDDVIERFRREAQTAASLRHPNVVTIYDYSEARDEATAYIVMEFVPGIPLGQFLKNGNRLSLERAVALMRHICAGVGAAHRRQIVHRDLKPDNIIVVPASGENETETVKVVDFGIAKLRDLATTRSLTQSGMIIGTPFYMSPEQCRGEELDARSDVYSLGVMFYEMIAGMRPFNAPTPTGVIAKHLTEAPPPFHPTLKIPPRVEAVIQRALAKDPQARQSHATAFAFSLEAAMRQALFEDVTKAEKRDSAMPRVPNIPPLLAKTPSHSGRTALIATAVVIGFLIGAYALLVRRAPQALPSQAVLQFATPTPSATPSRQAINTKTLAGKTNKTTSEASSRSVKSPPNAMVMSHPTPRPRIVPPSTPLGPYKAQVKSRPEVKDVFTSAPSIEQSPVKRIPRRVQARENSEEIPPEIRRMLEQMIQGAVTTRQSNGGVTKIYVTRPNN